MNDDGGYGLLAAYIGGPAAQADWLGPKVGGHLTPFLYSSREPSELSQWLCYDDSTDYTNIIIVTCWLQMADWLAAMELLVLVSMATNWSPGDAGKAFRVALSTIDGSVLCAVSDINQTSSVTDLPDDNLPAQVRCARHCTSQTSCHSFNYHSDNYACLFFYYPPTTCQTIPDCLYYQVTSRTKTIANLL